MTTSTIYFPPRSASLLLLTATLSILVSSCAGGDKFLHAPFADESSLVFGYIDMTDAPSDIRWIQMKKIRSESKTPYYSMRVEKGMIYRAYVPDGLYKFDKFGGYSFRLGGIEMTYAFPSQGKQEIDPVIKGPGIYYVGAYKYQKLDAPALEIRYRLVRVNQPTEEELLRRLLDKAVHPSWKERIEQRLKEIRK